MIILKFNRRLIGVIQELLNLGALITDAVLKIANELPNGISKRAILKWYEKNKKILQNYLEKIAYI